MALTRDDVCKMKINSDKYNTGLSYMLNVPGNGTNPNYFDDPQIRLQKFGANLSINVVDINSGLAGVNKQLDRDHYVKNTRDPAFNDYYLRNSYPIIKEAITDQPRATQPAWELRGLEQNHWNYLLKNPQNHTEISFEHNINSRILEKDNYKPQC